MKRLYQNKFYESVGQQLTEAAKDKKLSVSQIASKSGEQFNTIKAALDGKPFMIHQAAWILKVLEVDLAGMIKIATKNIEGSNVEVKKESKQKSNSVGLSSFI